jgi:hypothetical protein
VVDDVLPAAHDVLPLGQVAAEQTDLVHLHQGAHHAVLGIEDAQQRGRSLRVAAQRVVDQIELRADHAPRRARERSAPVLRDREGGQQAHRAASQLGRVRNLELAVHDDEAVFDRDALGGRRRRTAARGALLHHDLGERLQRTRGAVVVAHEALDGQHVSVIAVAERLRDLLLVAEVELVETAARA